MSTTALSANALVGRHAPEAAPSPGGTPRRRPRIAGTTTEPLPVRACSGDVLGRSDSGRVRRLAVAVRWRVARDVSFAVNDRVAADRT